MLRKRIVAVILVMVSSSVWSAASHAAPTADRGGALATPLGDGSQVWPKEAKIVLAADLVLASYADFSPKLQARLAVAAYRVAQRRRAALKNLIQSDPRLALLLSLTPAQRQGLPKFILDQLESREHAVGELSLLITETLPSGPKDTVPNVPNVLDVTPPTSSSLWTARIGESTRQAFVYGLRLEHQTKFDAPIHGIALDELFAVSELQLYQYDAFESVQLGFKPGEIVATSGGSPIPLPDIQALEELEQDLRGRVLRFGPLPLPFNPNDWTTGIKRLLVIKAQFANDARETPYSDGEIAGWVGGANTFFQENSQGRVSFNTTIISAPLPVLAIETYRDVSSEDLGHGILKDSAVQAARARGYAPDSYDRIVVLAPQLFDHPKATGELGGQVVVVTSDRRGDLRVTLAHELGHTFGFAHSTYLRPANPADPSGPGTSFEYGDMWDMMGAANLDDTVANPQRRHFNAFFKALAGWLPASNVADATLGGTYRLHAHDAADAVGLRAIFIDVGGGTVYWLGRRAQFPWNLSISNGIEVRRVSDFTSSGYGPVELLDIPQIGVPSSSLAHSLVWPSNFTDTPSGVTVRVGAAIAEDALGEYLEVFVTRF